MLREGLLFLGESSRARRFVTHAPGARTLARRFVAGETVDDAVVAAQGVNRQGMSVSLDYLGEAVHNRSAAEAAADVYLAVLDRIAADKLDANVSLKLTQMGQDIDTSFLRENVGRVLDRAREYGIFIRFDMESSAYTQRTLDFFRQIRAEGYGDVGVVIQSYLYRSEADVRELNAPGARVRLCKGAYLEPEEVAYADKSDVDASFVRLMQLLVSDGVYPGIATHDPDMIAATESFVKEQGISSSAFEFQMLYGVRRDIQQGLIDRGYNLRIYIPFGEAWYPYLMRRMAERPANLFFLVNAIARESPLRFLLPGRRSRNGQRR